MDTEKLQEISEKLSEVQADIDALLGGDELEEEDMEDESSEDDWTDAPPKKKMGNGKKTGKVAAMLALMKK